MAIRKRIKELAESAPGGSVVRKIPAGPLGQLVDVPFNARTLYEAGVIRVNRPDKVARTLRELIRWGASPAAGVATGAISRGEETALVDEAGSLTFTELDKRSNALARALADEGIGEGDGIAIMCRNHRGFIDATLACAKLGAQALYLNTAFAAPQLAGVVENERPTALIYDEEFRELLGEALEADGGEDLQRFVAWADRDDDDVPAQAATGDVPDTALEDLIADTDHSPVDPPQEEARFIILTSGTTGTPKGAQRSAPASLAPLAAMFSRIPLRAEERTMIAAPLFHSWGMAHFQLGLSLRSTYVLRRKFDPEETLRATAESGATALVVVPVMMQRILELPEETIREYDLSNLRVTAASGSALPGELATKWMDTFGDNLYNLYGSTEVAWATIAIPEDLRAAPGTAGKPPRGTVVRIVDQEGEGEVSEGETGRIFVGNEMAFEGYTGGGGKDEYKGLLSSRRRRPLRRGGPPVHRRPRRRDDRLRRRERVPARGRGPALGPRLRQGGRGDRSRRRGVRPAPEGVHRHRRGRRPLRGRGQEARQVEPRRLQGPPRGRVPRRAAPQRDRQGPQARAGLGGLTPAGTGRRPVP